MKRETFHKEEIAGWDMTPVANKTIVWPFNEEAYTEFIEESPV